MAKFFRYTISAIIICTTIHVNAYTTPSQSMPYRSLDSILVALESDASDIPEAKTTLQREDAINKFTEKAKILIGKYTIDTTVIISDVKMKNKNTATISFNKIETPMFDRRKALAAFSLSPTWKIDLPLEENTALKVVPGQRLTLLGEASFVHYNNSITFYTDQGAFLRLKYKNYLAGGMIKFSPTAYKIEKSAPEPKPVKRIDNKPRVYNSQYAQPSHKIQVITPPPGNIKLYEKPRPKKFNKYEDEYISFYCPASWKVTTFKTNNLYMVTCTGDKELFSIIYHYKKLDPIDIINAWVNKHHIPEISRQEIIKTQFLNSPVNTCYYYTKVNKFVHIGCVKALNTKEGNTVIINKRAKSKDDMNDPSGAIHIIDKSFKLVSSK
jgi:hypothetical protein